MVIRAPSPMNLAAIAASAPEGRHAPREGRQRHGRSSAASAGPLTVAMTVTERDRRRLSSRTLRHRAGGRAQGAADRRRRHRPPRPPGRRGARFLRRRQGDGTPPGRAEAGAFLIASDISDDPGFAARRDRSMALRRNLGPVGMTVAMESGEVCQDRHQPPRPARPSLGQRLVRPQFRQAPGCRPGSRSWTRSGRCSAAGSARLSAAAARRACSWTSRRGASWARAWWRH